MPITIDKRTTAGGSRLAIPDRDPRRDQILAAHPLPVLSTASGEQLPDDEPQFHRREHLGVVRYGAHHTENVTGTNTPPGTPSSPREPSGG